MSFAEGTTVPVEKTRAEIERLVAKYGATRFASGWQEGSAAINFTASGRLVRFVLPMPTKEQALKACKAKQAWWRDTDTKVAQWLDAENRRRWRCLLLAIKSRLEVVETGIETFEEAFLSHIVTDENITVWERIRLEDSGVKLLGAVGSTP